MSTTTQKMFIAKLEELARKAKCELVQDPGVGSNTGTWRFVAPGALDSNRSVTFNFQASQSTWNGYEKARREPVARWIHVPSVPGTRSLDQIVVEIWSFLLDAPVHHGRVQVDEEARRSMYAGAWL